jgi:futalosine hydrolase
MLPGEKYDRRNAYFYTDNPQPMNILIVAATLQEIRPFVNQLPPGEPLTENLTRYHFRGNPTDILVTGIGMVPTAFLTGFYAGRRAYEAAVNAGIAGTFTDTIPVGSVVEVMEEEIPELGAEEGDQWLSAFELGLADPDQAPFAGGRIINPGGIRSAVLDRLPKVSGSTVHTLHGSRAGIERARRRSQADIESMEGAAFLYACLSAGIPCTQIRAISNRVEIRDKSMWDIPLAVRNLNVVLSDFLSELVNFPGK